MRIAIIGASGMVGSRLTDEATRAGHDVTRVSRSATQAAPNLRADATDAVAMANLAATHDVLVLATRPSPGDEQEVTRPVSTVLDAALVEGRRVIVVGGAGPLHSPDRPDLLVLDDPRFVPPAWRAVAAASVAQLEACTTHRADWTYVSPPADLRPGARTGVFRRGSSTLLVDDTGRSHLSAEDLAVAIVDEIERPRFEGRHLTFAS